MIEPRKLRWWLMLAVLACAGLYLLGNGRVPLWDRDEGWYAQCSKEMWETGDWVVPRFLGDLRAEKPAFVYWLQLGGYGLFGGVSEFAVRFYAAVAQTIVLVMLGVGFWKLAGPLRGVWTAVIYGTCAMAIISAKMCLTDATLMICLMTAQLCLMRFYLGRFSWAGVMLIFLALGIGGLVKGPVALVPPAFTLIAMAALDFDKWWPKIRSSRFAGLDGTFYITLLATFIAFILLKNPDIQKAMPAALVKFWWVALLPFPVGMLLLAAVNREGSPRGEGLSLISLSLLVLLGGLVVVVLVCAPWLIPLHLRAPEWIPRTLNMAGQHLNTPLENHSGPFGYYLLLVWGTFFPWSLLLPTAVYIAWKQRHVPQTRFAIAAILGPWVFFEVMKTKLPHYVLPTFPFMALLVADALVRCTRGQYQELYKLRFTLSVLVWAVVVGVIGCGTWVLALPPVHMGSLEIWKGADFGPYPYAAMTAMSIVGFLFTLGTWWFFNARRPYLAAAWMAGGFIAFIAVAYGWYLPQAKFLHLSKEIAQVINENGGSADKMPKAGDVASLVYPREKPGKEPGKMEDATLGYREPTLPFYQGGSLRVFEVNDYLKVTPSEKWPKMMVLTGEIWEETPPELQEKLDILGKRHGLAYADGGRTYDLYVVRPNDKAKAAADPALPGQ